MSYAPQRDLTGELVEGLTDGSHKKVIQGRGGPVPEDQHSRDLLADTWYGVHESPQKTDPQGRIVRTPNYRPTRPLTYPGG
ncbi:hypothetical protein ACFVGM_08655 [Kitasatospora purpeofusca]|uniref:hypothetical protein n=1 Tax=Kitasatospora purpeofusca TaxID=67352 RepID=UPI0036B4257C